MGFVRKVALRYLWSKRSEAFITIITFVSVLGVAIGVMVLNMVMAVMTGFEHELQQKIVGANSHVTIRSLNGKLNGWKDIAEITKKIPGVKAVSPFTQHQGLIRSETQATGLIIRGIEQGTSAANQLGHYMDQSSSVELLFDPPALEESAQEQGAEVKLPGIVVGRELARTFGLFEGMAVSILSPQVSSTPFGLVPRFKRFVVVGIYHSGLIEYESGLAYVSMPEAQRFFRTGEAVSGIEVQVQDVQKAPAVSEAINDALATHGQGFYAQDWIATNQPLWSMIKLEKRAYFIVLLLIVIMAAFSIVTTLIMVVLEKRKDIAVLRTLGASSRTVAKIFILQGSVIGALGTIAGLALGYVGCIALDAYGFPIDERVFQMSTVPVRIEMINFVVTGAAAFMISCLATIYPAIRASKLRPSNVLRYG